MNWFYFLDKPSTGIDLYNINHLDKSPSIDIIVISMI